MKEKGFSNFISLLIILSLHGVILSFVLTIGIFLKTSLLREWMLKSRAFQEKSLKELLVSWTEKIYEFEDEDKVFEKVLMKGKEEDFNYETFLEFEKLKESGCEIPFIFLASSRTWRGKYESKTVIKGESKFFRGNIPLSLFPLAIESIDSAKEINIFSNLLPKERFPFPISILLNFSEELIEKIKNSGEGIFYFDSLEKPVLFFNQDVEKIEFGREIDFQILNIISMGKQVSLRIGNNGSIFQNYDGKLINSEPCKLILINGKVESISSKEENVLIPSLDLTIISSGSIKIETSIEGANSLLGICSIGFDIINGEERESFIKITQNANSIRASILSAGNIETEGDLFIKGSLQAKRIEGKKIKIFVQDYLVSGLNPTFYPLTAENNFFIGKLNIEEWREE